jgi:hypothetical protein
VLRLQVSQQARTKNVQGQHKNFNKESGTNAPYSFRGRSLGLNFLN